MQLTRSKFNRSLLLVPSPWLPAPGFELDGIGWGRTDDVVRSPTDGLSIVEQHIIITFRLCITVTVQSFISFNQVSFIPKPQEL